MDPLIDVAPAAPAPPPPIDVAGPDEVARPAPLPEVAADRAYKLTTGLPGFGSYEDVYKQIIAGQEGQVRDLASTYANAKKEGVRQSLITKMAVASGGSLSPSDLTNLDKLINASITTDPKSVVEENYSAEFLEKVRKAGLMNNSAWKEAEPDSVENSIKNGRELLTKLNFLRTVGLDVDETAQSQSWFGWGVDRLKEQVPFYAALKLRNNVPGMDEDHTRFFLGSQLEEESKRLFMLPFPEFKKAVLATTERLKQDNPALAASWLQAMLGQTSDERSFNNLSSILDPAFAGSAIYGAGKFGGRITRAYRNNKIVDDHINSAILHEGRAPATEAVASEAVGDLAGAGRATLNKTIVDEIQGAGGGISEAFLGLHQAYTPSADSVMTNVGTLGREYATRLQLRYQELQAATIDGITKAINVDRLPALTAVDNTTAKLAEGLKGTYPGMENRILDQRVNYDPYSKGRIVTTALGDEDALIFKDYKTAELFTDQNFFNDKKFGIKPLMISNEGLIGPVKPEFVGPIKPAPHIPGSLGGKFKTSDGLDVRLHPDGTTTTPGYSRSSKTVYVTPEAAESLSAHTEPTRVVIKADGTISVEAKIGRTWAQAFREKGEASATAKEGLHPIELSGGRTTKGDRTYTDLKIRSKIDSIEHVQPKDPNAPVVPPKITIKQQGVGYYLELTKPLDETAPYVRNNLILTKNDQTPLSIKNAFLGGWAGSARSPEDTMAINQILNRKRATFGQNVFYDLAKETGKELSDFKRGAWKGTTRRQRLDTLNQVIDEVKAQGLKDADGRPKRFHDTIGDLQQHYMNKRGTLPDEQEVGAYFSYKRLEELRDVWHNYNYYKSMVRKGAREFTVSGYDPAKETKARNYSSGRTFNGKTIDHLPNDGERVFVLAKDGRLDNSKIPRTQDLVGGKFGEELKEDIAKGRRVVIEHLEPGLETFKGLLAHDPDAGRVKYIIATPDMVRETQMPWVMNKLRRPPDMDFEHAVVQPIMNKDERTGFLNYEGDRKLGLFNIHGMARDIAKHLDEVRLLLKDNKLAEAEAHHNSVRSGRDRIAMSFEDVRRWFIPDDLGYPTRGAILSLDHPIMTAPKNKLSIQTAEGDKIIKMDGFKDRAREGFGKFQTDDHYDFQDLFSADNIGTVDSPLYSIKPAQQVNPIASINRSLSNVINSVFLDDYKIFSVEHWIQEAKGLLTTSEKDLASHPLVHFYDPQWKEGLSGSDAIRMENLKTAQYQIKQLLGVHGKETTWLHNVAQIMSDSLYNKGFAKQALYPAAALPYLKDPFAFMRSVVFESTLGLFSPAQLLVQLNGYATIAGVAGFSYATPASKAALLYQWTRLSRNPEVIAHMDKLASTRIIPGTKMFKPGQFTEALGLLKDSGFDSVGVEHALRNMLSKDIISSDVERYVLSPGRFFFNEGERTVRAGAFFTSYLEFREANPFLKIGIKEQGAILQRADLLNANMSRASSSLIHQGIFSMPTQFFTYQIRLTELMLGKGRLTPVERMRLFGTYAALYGLPSAFGIFGFPTGDYLRKDALDHGYVAGENKLDTAVMEGLPALLLGMITGEQYNIGERYSVQGISAIRDALRSDKPFLSVATGAAGTKFMNLWSSLDPFTSVIGGFVRQDKNIFKPTLADYVQPLKEISLANNLIGLYAAMNTGKILSKNETYLGDTSIPNAIFSTITGLHDQQLSDAYTKVWSRATEKEAQSKGLKLFTREYGRFLDNAEVNPTQAHQHLTNGLIYLQISGYPVEDYDKAVALAAKGRESVISSINMDYYTKAVSEFRKKAAMRALPVALSKSR